MKKRYLNRKKKMIHGDGIYDTIGNWLFPSSNPQNKLRDGEKHVLMYNDK
jgi:hypothetical protein